MNTHNNNTDDMNTSNKPKTKTFDSINTASSTKTYEMNTYKKPNTVSSVSSVSSVLSVPKPADIYRRKMEEKASRIKKLFSNAV